MIYMTDKSSINIHPARGKFFLAYFSNRVGHCIELRWRVSVMDVVQWNYKEYALYDDLSVF